MSRGMGVPRSATVGRRSAGAVARRTSTRPRIVPARAASRLATVGGTEAEACISATKDTKAAATRNACALCALGVPLFILCVLVLCSKPEHQLNSAKHGMAQEDAAVARVPLHRRLQQQVPLNRVAGADFGARDRRVPRQRAERCARHLAEAEVIVDRKRVV